MCYFLLISYSITQGQILPLYDMVRESGFRSLRVPCRAKVNHLGKQILLTPYIIYKK